MIKDVKTDEVSICAPIVSLLDILSKGNPMESALLTTIAPFMRKLLRMVRNMVNA
jgi:hypothetical protein